MSSRRWWCIRLFSLVVVVSFYVFATPRLVSVVEENKLQGDEAWFVPMSSQRPFVEGFSLPFSVSSSENVHFKLNCSLQVSDITLEVFRLGYYHGRGARRIDSVAVSSTLCQRQPACILDPSDRVTDCSNWQVTVTWIVPKNAVSGVFVALPRFTLNGTNPTEGSFQIPRQHGEYIPFVVHDFSHTTSLRSDILFKTSDLTWVAYNKFGGWNVYGGNNSKDFASRAFKASYDRPFANRMTYPAGQSQNFLFSTEFPMLFWLEKQGYNISYASCGDIETLYETGQLLGRYRALLSVGHDEYWTPQLKKAFFTARNEGMHLAFFSGNEIFWRVLWQEDHDIILQQYSKNNTTSVQIVDKRWGKRMFVCRKESIDNAPSPFTFSQSSPDPKYVRSSKIANPSLTAALWTGTFMDPRWRAPEPENILSGQLFGVNSYRNDSLRVDSFHGRLRFWRDTIVAVKSQLTHASQARRSLSLSTSTSSLSASQSKSKPRPGSKAHAEHLVKPVLIYESPPGLLGYEWDVFVDDVFRPAGAFSLSSTRLHIQQHLLQTFGASYRGKGTVAHKLSLYRHHRYEITNSTSSPESDQNYSSYRDGHASHRSNRMLCASPNSNVSALAATTQINHAKSSLVFGAGTIQWAWALSDMRDGDHMVVDNVLQQTTLNLLADMDVLPDRRAFEAQFTLRTITESFAADSIASKTTSEVGLVQESRSFLSGNSSYEKHFTGKGERKTIKDRNISDRATQRRSLSQRASSSTVMSKGATMTESTSPSTSLLRYPRRNGDITPPVSILHHPSPLHAISLTNNHYNHGNTSINHTSRSGPSDVDTKEASCSLKSLESHMTTVHVDLRNFLRTHPSPRMTRDNSTGSTNNIRSHRLKKSQQHVSSTGVHSHQQASSVTLRLQGIAKDLAPFHPITTSPPSSYISSSGRVATVEISLNAGRTWHLTSLSTLAPTNSSVPSVDQSQRQRDTDPDIGAEDKVEDEVVYWHYVHHFLSPVRESLHSYSNDYLPQHLTRVNAAHSSNAHLDGQETSIVGFRSTMELCRHFVSYEPDAKSETESDAATVAREDHCRSFLLQHRQQEEKESNVSSLYDVLHRHRVVHSATYPRSSEEKDPHTVWLYDEEEDLQRIHLSSLFSSSSSLSSSSAAEKKVPKSQRRLRSRGDRSGPGRQSVAVEEQLRTTDTPEERKVVRYMLVMVRAVDDSGWIESTAVNAAVDVDALLRQCLFSDDNTEEKEGKTNKLKRVLDHLCAVHRVQNVAVVKVVFTWQ